MQCGNKKTGLCDRLTTGRAAWGCDYTGCTCREGGAHVVTPASQITALLPGLPSGCVKTLSLEPREPGANPSCRPTWLLLSRQGYKGSEPQTGPHSRHLVCLSLCLLFLPSCLGLCPFLSPLPAFGQSLFLYLSVTLHLSSSSIPPASKSPHTSFLHLHPLGSVSGTWGSGHWGRGSSPGHRLQDAVQTSSGGAFPLLPNLGLLHLPQQPKNEAPPQSALCPPTSALRDPVLPVPGLSVPELASLVGERALAFMTPRNCAGRARGPP